MDLHEWEILSDDGLLDYKDDQKKIVSAKRRSGSDAKIVFDMNYFLCPSMDSSSKQHISQPSSSRLVKQPIPVHLQLDSPIVRIPDDDSLALKEKEKEKESIVIGVVPSAMSEKDQKGARSSNKGTKPQIDVGHYQFDDGGESKENITNSPRMNLMSQKSNKEIDANKDGMNWDGSMGGLNILKWSLNGIGAICSFGVAAATICILQTLQNPFSLIPD